ncbi:hypothetical protein ACLB1S_12680 [Escherichia coli]
MVEPTLQTTRDPDVATGDCASCPRPEGGFVPAACSGCTPDGDLRNEQHTGADER